MSGKNTIAVVIPAAGSGTRMAAEENKIFLPLGGETLIERCVRNFQQHPDVGRIVIVGQTGDLSRLEVLFGAGDRWNKVEACISGGEDRRQSVKLGLEHLEQEPPSNVLVHDGARPFCSREVIDRVIRALEQYPAVVPGLPIHDTVRRVTEAHTEVIDREGLFRSQTPQGFHFFPLLAAHQIAIKHGTKTTDDGQLMEARGLSVHIVPGDRENLKITTREDLDLAVALWKRTSG